MIFLILNNLAQMFIGKIKHQGKNANVFFLYYFCSKYRIKGR